MKSQFYNYYYSGDLTILEGQIYFNSGSAYYDDEFFEDLGMMSATWEYGEGWE